MTSPNAPSPAKIMTIPIDTLARAMRQGDPIELSLPASGATVSAAPDPEAPERVVLTTLSWRALTPFHPMRKAIEASAAKVSAQASEVEISWRRSGEFVASVSPEIGRVEEALEVMDQALVKLGRALSAFEGSGHPRTRPPRAERPEHHRQPRRPGAELDAEGLHVEDLELAYLPDEVRHRLVELLAGRGPERPLLFRRQRLLRVQLVVLALAAACLVGFSVLVGAHVNPLEALHSDPYEVFSHVLYTLIFTPLVVAASIPLWFRLLRRRHGFVPGEYIFPTFYLRTDGQRLTIYRWLEARFEDGHDGRLDTFMMDRHPVSLTGGRLEGDLQEAARQVEAAAPEPGLGLQALGGWDPLDVKLGAGWSLSRLPAWALGLPVALVVSAVVAAPLTFAVGYHQQQRALDALDLRLQEARALLEDDDWGGPPRLRALEKVCREAKEWDTAGTRRLRDEFCPGVRELRPLGLREIGAMQEYLTSGEEPYRELIRRRLKRRYGGVSLGERQIDPLPKLMRQMLADDPGTRFAVLWRPTFSSVFEIQDVVLSVITALVGDTIAGTRYHSASAYLDSQWLEHWEQTFSRSTARLHAAAARHTAFSFDARRQPARSLRAPAPREPGEGLEARIERAWAEHLAQPMEAFDVPTLVISYLVVPQDRFVFIEGHGTQDAYQPFELWYDLRFVDTAGATLWEQQVRVRPQEGVELKDDPTAAGVYDAITRDAFRALQERVEWED